ncbi:hypothetical protein [Xanthomarina spongicola]|uniref:Uncharacterized protein n=1 Tax=Xanthomarina spongicola TaxID=570520 RepID=A0A316DG51_9FLAO|nr:hypothetical protein LX78_02817 [Xanthomarina spongicola]
MNLNLRQEHPKDYVEEFIVIEKAFEPVMLSDHKEQFLVERLRKSKNFIPELSIIAEIGNKK